LDFELSPNGHFVGEDLTDQQVYLALVTTLGTAAQLDLGNALSSIKMITPDITSLVSTVINNALSDLINSGQITINNLTISVPQVGQIAVQIVFTNNDTEIQTKLNIPVRG
jgi:hypothetical protein